MACPNPGNREAMKAAMEARGAKNVQFDKNGRLYVQDAAHKKQLAKSRNMVDLDRYA